MALRHLPKDKLVQAKTGDKLCPRIPMGRNNNDNDNNSKTLVGGG